MRRIESNQQLRRSKSRKKSLKRPYFQILSSKKPKFDARSSLKSLKRRHSKNALRSRSPSQRNIQFNEAYFTKAYMMSSVKGRSSLVKKVDLEDLAKFSQNVNKNKKLSTRRSHSRRK
jgi:hypothetical protein